MLPDDVEWRDTGNWVQLVHRGLPVATIYPREGFVEVATRSYIQGYQHSRRLATVEGGKRYAEAWWLKWGGRARAEVARKLAGSAPMGWPEGYDPPVYPDINVPKRPHRRRR